MDSILNLSKTFCDPDSELSPTFPQPSAQRLAATRQIPARMLAKSLTDTRKRRTYDQRYFRPELFFPLALFAWDAAFAGACFPAPRSLPCGFAAAPAFAALACAIASA